MKPPVIVRHATIEDEEALFDLYVALQRDGGISRFFPYDYGRMFAGIQRATRKQGGICGVIQAPDRPGRFAGVVFLVLDKFWWSDCSFLFMREWYVRPEYRRGTGYYKALRQFAEDIRVSCNEARPSDHPPIILETSFLHDNPQRVKLMHRLWRQFGNFVGGVYVSGL